MTPMTEQIQDQLSAFVDDELSSEECAFFVRRLQRDPDSAHRVLRFATIGAALRGELVRPDPGVLLRRIDAALDGTVGSTAPPRQRRAAGAGLWRPALGVAISAGVAAVAVFLMRTVNMAGGEVGAVAGAPPLQAAGSSEPASYVVPQERASNDMISSPIRLTNYLMHHGEYASRVSRTMVNSNVIVSVSDLVETELEEAPVGAAAGAPPERPQ